MYWIFLVAKCLEYIFNVVHSSWTYSLDLNMYICKSQGGGLQMGLSEEGYLLRFAFCHLFIEVLIVSLEISETEMCPVVC